MILSYFSCAETTNIFGSIYIFSTIYGLYEIDVFSVDKIHFWLMSYLAAAQFQEVGQTERREDNKEEVAGERALRRGRLSHIKNKLNYLCCLFLCYFSYSICLLFQAAWINPG